MARKQSRIGLYVLKNNTIDKYFQVLYLINEMQKSKDFELFLLYDHDDVDPAIKKYFYNFIDLRYFDINSLGLNAIIVNDPYSQPIIPYDKIKTPVIYKEYGVAGAEERFGYLVKKKVCKFSDMVITESDFTRSRILNFYPDKYVVCASPAFDYVFDSYGSFDKNYIHVLWTPHHSIVAESQYDNIVGGPYSTFLTTKDFFTGEFLNDHPEVILHIKYHPVLEKRYNQFTNSRSGFKNWKTQVSDNPRVIIHDHGDYHDLFMKSDICINDSLSFIQEWLPTNKPMIVLRNGARYSEFGEEIISTCYDSIFVNKYSREEFRKEFNTKFENTISAVHDNSNFMLAHKMINKERKKNCELLVKLIKERYGTRND